MVVETCGVAGAQLSQRREPASVYDLKLAIETALRNHPALSVAGARRQAATTHTAVAGAQYRPFVEGISSLGGTLAGDRTLAFRDDSTARGFQSNPFYTAAVRFVLPLFREGTSPLLTLPSEVVARATHASAQQAERLARVEIVGNATMAFYSVLAAGEALAASREVVDVNHALHESTRRRFEQQLVPQSVVLTVEASLAAARAQLAAAEASLTKARELFALALGLDPWSDVTRSLQAVETQEPQPPLSPFDELLKRMTTGHPSVLIQQAKIKEAEATIALLRTQRYPTLDAVTAIGAIDDFSTPVDGWSLRAFLRLNWNIYDFGLLRLKIQEQSEMAEAERRTLEQVKTQLAQALVAAYQNVAASRSRLESSEKAIAAATEEVRVAEHRQRQSLASIEEVLGARLKLVTARTEMTKARYAILIDEAAVKMAAGAE